MSQYERHKTYPVNDILPILQNISSQNRQKDKRYIELDGVQVKTNSQRYAVFQKSTKCVCCGLEACFFASEKVKYDKTDKYHFNLYGVNEQGEEVLFTKDHIIPVSKGGKNIIENYQTMCATCNQEKQDNIDPHVAKLIKHNDKPANKLRRRLDRLNRRYCLALAYINTLSENGDEKATKILNQINSLEIEDCRNDENIMP